MTIGGPIRRLILAVLLICAGAPAFAQQADARERPARYAHILFNAGINKGSTQALVDALQDAVIYKADEIHLVISSTGGEVNRSLFLNGLLRNLDVPLHTYAIGEVNSAALNLFLAGDSRTTDAFASFLFHSYQFGNTPNTDTNYYRELYEHQQGLLSVAAALTSDATDLEYDEVLEILSGSHRIMTSNEAIRAGVADRIGQAPWTFADGKARYYEVID